MQRTMSNQALTRKEAFSMLMAEGRNQGSGSRKTVQGLRAQPMDEEVYDIDLESDEL